MDTAPRKRTARVRVQKSTPLTTAEIAAQLREQDTHYDNAIAAEAQSAKHFMPKFDSMSHTAKEFLYAIAVVSLLGFGAFMGGWGKSWVDQSKSNHEIALAMRTAIPVVRALDIDVDPGKYDSKLMDVVLNITKGGVYKSGKALYLQENEGGFSVVIFESAFPGFLVEGEQPSSIIARYVGKTVKARGTVRSYGQSKDGQKRMSLILYAPGLISEITER